MHADTLHRVAAMLIRLGDQTKQFVAIRDLVASLEVVTSQPGSADAHKTLAEKIAAAEEANKRGAAVKLLQSDIDAVLELHLGNLLPPVMARDVTAALRASSISPQRTLELLKPIQEEIEIDVDSLVAIVEGLERFKVPKEEPDLNEPLMSTIIPRHLADSDLKRLATEINAVDRMLKPLVEVADGRRTDLPIKRIASSDFLIQAAVGYAALKVIGDCIKWGLERVKTLAEIDNIRAQTRALKLPPEATAPLEDHAKKLAKSAIDAKTQELLDQSKVSEERKNELDKMLNDSLTKLIDRLMRGYVFEIRIAARPKDTSGDLTPLENGVPDELYAEVADLSKDIKRVQASNVDVLQLEASKDED